MLKTTSTSVRVGLVMWVGGAAGLIHAIFPFLCVPTGAAGSANYITEWIARRDDPTYPGKEIKNWPIDSV